LNIANLFFVFLVAFLLTILPSSSQSTTVFHPERGAEKYVVKDTEVPIMNDTNLRQT
jgi:hypothetical protein